MNAQQIIRDVESRGIFLTTKADKLVIRSPKGALTDDLKNLIQENKNSIMEVVAYYGFTKGQIKAFLGEDWGLCSDNEKTLQAWAHSLYERKLMEAGQVPPDFTARAYCKSCQQYVFLPPAIVANNVLFGCLWCLNRAKGLPIPNPNQERGLS